MVKITERPRAAVHARGAVSEQLLAGFTAWLRADGFASSTIDVFKATASHVARWAKQASVPLHALDRRKVTIMRTPTGRAASRPHRGKRAHTA